MYNVYASVNLGVSLPVHRMEYEPGSTAGSGALVPQLLSTYGSTRAKARLVKSALLYHSA